MPSGSEDKSLGTLDEREKRFKAMLQYLILREACDFESNVNDTEEKKAQYAKESAEKILTKMELKFYDLFVKDDLVENYLFLDVPCKTDAFNQKDIFKKLIQQKISDKITVINSTDTADPSDTANTADKASQQNKKLLEKIVRSPKIENLIMVCDLPSDPKNTYLTELSNSKNSYLISDIDNVFNSSNLASITDNALVKIRDIFLSEADNECCKIEENSIAIHAHLKTATAFSLGFLNLTGKLIAKTLGLETDSKSEVENSPVTPSKSVRGEIITKILNSLKPTQGYV